MADLLDLLAEMERRNGPFPRIEGAIERHGDQLIVTDLHYVSVEDEARALIMQMDAEVREGA